MTENHKHEFQRSSSIICAYSSSRRVIVEIISLPPAAGGSAIPSQIGQCELRVLLAALGGDLGKRLCTEEAVSFFVTVGENLCGLCANFCAADQRHVQKK